jgi:hypothetical protein
VYEFDCCTVRDVFSYGGGAAAGTFAGAEFRDCDLTDPADCGVGIDPVYGVAEVGASSDTSSDMIADDHA